MTDYYFWLGAEAEAVDERCVTAQYAFPEERDESQKQNGETE
jgi:hypothetical protein